MTESGTTRRELLAGLARAMAFGGLASALHPWRALALSTAGASPPAPVRRPVAPSLRVGLVLGGDAGPRGAASLRAGLELGAEEAARTASLLGGRVTLARALAQEAERDPAAAARRLVERDGVRAIVGGADDASASAIAAVAESLAIPFLNVGARADALRRTGRGGCAGGFTFHVEASGRMYDDALSLAPEGAARGGAGGRVVLWHESLERYGALQLNDRFRARFGRGMDGPAWAGWFAMKALWECAARGAGAGTPGGASPEGAALAGALRAARFDGHKGRRLSFRAWDGQLRQPLYLIPPEGTAGGIVEVPEAPRGERAEGARVDPETLLDRLGAPAPQGACAGGAP